MLDYFRRDQASGITPPDLAQNCSFVDHIVKTRGRKTQYTSVSLNLNSVRHFVGVDYRLERQKLDGDSHILVEHTDLLASLRTTISSTMRGDKLRALRALSFARRNSEGLIDWKFELAGVPQKDLITWVTPRVNGYFSRI